MISVASSIKFRKDDGLRPSFDNTMFADESFYRVAKHPFYQTFFTDDVIKIQAEVDSPYTMEMQYAECTGSYRGKALFGDWTNMSGEELVMNGATYDYYEVEIDFSTFSVALLKFRARIMDGESVIETWTSEPVELIAENMKYLQFEFFNLENAFNVYYVNPTEADRISHLLRIKGNLRKYKPSGETSVVDNQSEVTKVKDWVKRMMTLETAPIPAYLAEMLAVAMAHDKFFINEVEYVAEGKPDFDLGDGDLAPLTVQLTQRSVIGLNTHDTGFDCETITDTNMIVLQEDDASGEVSFNLTDDYMVLSITGLRTAGSPVIKAGYTPGGDEILTSMELTEDYASEVALVPTDKSSITGGVLYVTVSGSGATADIVVITLKNRQ